MDIYQQISQNKTRSSLFILLFIGVIIGIAYFIGYFFGLGIWALIPAGIIALLSALAGYYNADSVALRVAGAKPIAKKDSPQIYNLVENLTITTGLPMPKIYIINDPSPNAFATGRDPEHASIAMTTGLLEKLEKVELEGVIAHELSHVKNYDMRLMTLVVVFVGTITLLGGFFWRFGLISGRGSNRNSGQAGLVIFLVGLVFLILSPIVAKLIQMAISRKREYLADASAALTTRFPEGLARALEKIGQSPYPMLRNNKAVAHLYISEPRKKKGQFLSGLFSTHPPIEERVKRLREM
jgi:heat shock protein HtpX